ncbi:MAG: class I SAM-dependent methyltransferase [Chthoniobacteraceae bacterium]
MTDHFETRKSCPCCGAEGGVLLYEKPFCDAPIRGYLEAFYQPQGGVEFGFLEGTAFTLIECGQCGLIFQKHIPNDALMVRLYDRWIDPARVFALIDGRQGAAYFMSLAKQVANVTEWFRKPPSELRCLDFGMGWGHWCRIARGFGCEVAGVELSEVRIAFARKAGLQVLAYDDLPDHGFDYINTEQVFEHIPQPFETLAYLKQSLKPGGLIRISVPDGWGIRRKLARGNWLAQKGSRDSLNAVAPLEHINCFHYHAIVKLAARAGLNEQIVPDVHSTLLPDAVRDAVKPHYFRLRGRRDTALYFTPAVAA